ncbi:MAG: hypothetical protein SVR94_04235 [Pseudomonadota bacterium]|nr:hypothetical protein [Pseudomonadota bacterium]
MAVSEAAKKHFLDQIRLKTFDDQYLDREEEKKVLEMGIKEGLSVNEGLALIHQFAQEKKIIVEREVEERVKELLERFAVNDGVVDKKEFEDTLALFKTATYGKIPETELKKRLKQMMLTHGWKAKEGGLFGSKWFSSI